MKNSRFVLATALVAVALIGVVYCLNRRGVMSEDTIVRPATSLPTAVSSGGEKTQMPSSAAALLPDGQTPTARGTLPYVLTSKEPIDSTLRQAAESLGAKTVDVLSRHSLLVEAREDVRARLSADGRFEEMTEFVPSGKVQPELLVLIDSGVKSVDVSLVALSAEDRETVISCLEHGGGEMLTGCINEGDVIRATLPSTLVANLAGRGDVRWLEKFERPHLMNDLAVNAEMMNVREAWDVHGLNGTNQVISTSDSGIDSGNLETMHEDLRHRVKEVKVVKGCYDHDENGHGTHTAGSIVGDGTKSDGKIRGSAYGADLYAWFSGGADGYIYLPDTLSALFTNDGNWNAHVHSASWGSTTLGRYDAQCAQNDEYVWNHPEFLPVYSAGNDGYTYGDYSIGSPAAAKNVLTVGATQSSREGYDGGWGNGNPKATAIFSSRGPCQDGRVKPDVAAPGVGILSTRSHGVDYGYGVYDEFYAYDSGTSMSCPLTAGAVALVRQWLVDPKFNKGFKEEKGKRPTSALMKAIIMGGARDATTPNNDQGWGRVDIAGTLFPTGGRDVMLIDRIPFEQGFVTNIVVETTNAAPLDVQLVWVDYPGSASGSQSAAKLINDIDLTVKAPIVGEPLTFYYGNGGTKADTLNNAESVHIANAKPAKYIIEINCKQIVYDYTQGGAAALYVRGAFDPKATPDYPGYVHLKKLDKNFLSLDSALAAIETEDETVEILSAVNLDKSVTLTKSCTILATNENAVASLVTRVKDAAFTVSNGVTVVVSNIVFSTSQKTLLTANAGGCIALGKGADLGVGLDDGVAVKTADANGLKILGLPARMFLLSCAMATKEPEKFGSYACGEDIAKSAAAMIMCADDANRETIGTAEAGDLRWKVSTVPIDAAAGYYVDRNGNTNAYARLDRVVEQFEKALNAGTLSSASNLILRKDGVLSQGLTISHPATISGENGAVITPNNMTGIVIREGGDLTITNLTFRGGSVAQECSLIEVAGGEFTLAGDTVLDGIVGRRDFGSGVIDVNAGTATILPGSRIINCSAAGYEDGDGRGGAIYVDYNVKSTLNLRGGIITNCVAQKFGGGVYVFNPPGRAPTVTISGPITIAFNRSSNSVHDDICLNSDKSMANFALVGEATGKVGIRYDYSVPKTGNRYGDAFMTNAVGSVSEETLRVFFSDVSENEDTTEKLVASIGANGMLVWTRDARDGQCPKDDANIVVNAGGKTRYYKDLMTALAYVTGDAEFAIKNDDALTNDVEITGIVSFTKGDGSIAPTLWRKNGARCHVPSGASLTLTDISLAMQDEDWLGIVDNPLLAVDGGALTLGDHVCISNIFGNASRAANAITVYNKGTVVMQDGVQIVHCYNTYSPTAEAELENYGVGGGLLVDGADAYLYGGVITNCVAVRGGGVCACNFAKVYVSGKMQIVGNWRLDNGTPTVIDNLFVTDLSSVYLDGELTSFVGTSGMPWLAKDTNLVAKVRKDKWTWNVTALTNSAAHFTHDASWDVGVAVTNRDADALIVWSGAVKNGVYTNAEDKVVYSLVGEMPTITQPIVVNPPEDPPTPSPTSRYQLSFGTLNAFAIEPPNVEITDLEDVEGGLKVTVLVKDGDTPVKVTAADVAKLFQATSDVGDWTKSVKLQVTPLSSNADNTETFKVEPEGSPATTFIRLVY